MGSNNVVDFQNHLHYLGGKLELLLLRHDGLEDTLLVHVVGSLEGSVNSDEWVTLLDLLFLQVLNVLYWLET